MHLIRSTSLAWLACLCTLLSCCSRPTPKAAAATWHIDPVHGNDTNAGTAASQAWKTFAPLDQITLGPGDTVIVAPGHHERSLAPKAEGDVGNPAIIRFLPGMHEFGVEQATRRAYFVSNSCATPEVPIPIGILIKDCKHLTLTGAGTAGDTCTTLRMNGRMTHFINDHSESIEYRLLTFDLKRPTVSEYRVIARSENTADIRIAEASTYQFANGAFEWTGDIGSGTPLLQEAIPAEGRAWRTRATNNPLSLASRIEALGNDCFRLHFENHTPPEPGRQFQFRKIDRDIVGAHNNRCRDIRLTDVVFHAFAGMGIISQFCEDLNYQRVLVRPPDGTLRTCPAWADVFHFSGCRGTITIENCVGSGTQDDVVNVHGTHLRIVEKRGEQQLLLRFMHKQTYGFAAFQPGDEIAVIDHQTLREHPENPRRKVTAIERINNQDWLIQLDGPAPHFAENDVIDNLTWYPDVTIRGCHVDMDSCRGFLITTRGKVLIENNTIKRTRMPAILIENDANGWFESGPIRDMTIRNNTFIGAGIKIHPRSSSGTAPVHENIRITHNTFKEGAGIEAQHCAGLVIRNNLSDTGSIPIRLDPESTSADVGANEGTVTGR